MEMGWEMQWYQVQLRLKDHGRGHLATKPSVWCGALKDHVGGGKGETALGEGSTTQTWIGDGRGAGHDLNNQTL
eukprot:986554-Karenia_brevis.AAC.1